MPSDTVMVWLVAVPAVASGKHRRGDRQRRIDRQRVGLRQAGAGGVSDVDREARRPRRTGRAAERHRPRRGFVVRFAAVSPCRPATEARRC